jgi:hypothetical protein
MMYYYNLPQLGLDPVQPAVVGSIKAHILVLDPTSTYPIVQPKVATVPTKCGASADGEVTTLPNWFCGTIPEAGHSNPAGE